MSLPGATSPGSVGRYRLVRELGRGGWGVVWEGVGPDGAPVAVKRLSPRAQLLHPDAVERLRREVGVARLIEHPGVVRVLDAGTADGSPYVVQELVPGARPITDAFAERGLRERVALVRDAAAALGAAHARGVVHRDVSRNNVLVDEAGRVRVTDFGLAWLPGLSPLTATGVVLGTPGMIAPEVAISGSKASTTPAVDVWGLGLLLFQALTGTAPAAHDPTVAPPAPRDIDDRVPAPLDVVCRRALDRDPERRFATGAELAAALDAALRELDHTPGPLPESGLPAQGARAGMRLGRYLIVGRIGAGGMGTVFRARDEALGRDVALKVLVGSVTSERRARFLREQEAAARVRHPNIVAVHEAGEAGELSWLAMDLVEGEPLDDVLRRGPLEPLTAVRMVAACARAVEALHAAGILHRDIKPANVLIDERGSPLLTDFGVARLADADRLTRTGQGLGTPLYMAPEQLAGEPANERADVYGLGALLYEAVTGTVPWASTTLMGLMYDKSNPPPAPSTHRPGLPPGIDAVCLRALAPDPAERHESAARLAAELEGLLAGSGEPPLAAVARSRAWRLAAVAAAVVWALVVAAALTRRRHDAAASTTALVALREELEARARSARSLASLELDREALLDAAQEAPDERGAGAVRAWVGLVDLARGDEQAARQALSTLAGPALDEPAARALRGGLLARAGDPLAAAEDLEAARRAGVEHVEVEAWLLRALARRGLERIEAATWLDRVPALRAPGDARAGPADLLEVACLVGLERRIDAERAFGRLADPPPELRWDMAVLTAAERLGEGTPRGVLAAREHVERAARPPGPPRPLEVTLGRRAIDAMQAIIEKYEEPGAGALDAPTTNQLIALLELKGMSAPALALPEALTAPLVGLVLRTLILGHSAAGPPLVLALGDAWPEDAVIQETVVSALFESRFGEGHYLVPADPTLERRFAGAAERALPRVDRSRDLRFKARLVRAAALHNLGELDRAAAASTELEEALEALRAEDPARAEELGFGAFLVRARIAAARGDLDLALGLIARAEQGPRYDLSMPLCVRYEALVAAGRDDEALRLLTDFASDPPRTDGVALRWLAQHAWERFTVAGRWSELARLYERLYGVVSRPEVAHRLAWLRARDGDLRGAAEVIEALERQWGTPLANRGGALRRGDRGALELLERETSQPLPY